MSERYDAGYNGNDILQHSSIDAHDVTYDKNPPKVRSEAPIKRTPGEKVEVYNADDGKNGRVWTPTHTTKATTEKASAPKPDSKAPKNVAKVEKAEAKAPKPEAKAANADAKAPTADPKSPKPEAKASSAPKADAKAPSAPKAEAKPASAPKAEAKTVNATQKATTVKK